MPSGGGSFSCLSLICTRCSKKHQPLSGSIYYLTVGPLQSNSSFSLVALHKWSDWKRCFDIDLIKGGERWYFVLISALEGSLQAWRCEPQCEALLISTRVQSEHLLFVRDKPCSVDLYEALGNCVCNVPDFGSRFFAFPIC